MFSFDSSQTLLLACLALLLGMFVVSFTPFLKKNHIPEAVVGGFIVALTILVLDKTTGITVTFNQSLQELLMLAFFASIGLNSDFAKLRKGGPPLLLMTIVVGGMIIVQNVLGMGLAMILGESPFIGIIAGSITLTGGHGNAGAWGPLLEEKYGVTGGLELAIACATMGLVLGGLIGGPVARHLLKRVQIPTPISTENEVFNESLNSPIIKRKIDASNIIHTISMLIICISLGQFISSLFVDTFLQLPTFVWGLIIGILIRNTLSLVFKYEVYEPTIEVLGNVSLSLFLSMALMSLKFVQLTNMAGPILIIMAIQTVAMVLYACFVTFRVMGADYDAIVISAGHCGFGMGATPTAIANMQAITKVYSPSPKAFLIIPLIGGFVVNIVNTFAIKFFIVLGALFT